MCPSIGLVAPHYNSIPLYPISIDRVLMTVEYSVIPSFASVHLSITNSLTGIMKLEGSLPAGHQHAMSHYS